MEQIWLHAIHKENTVITYSFSFTEGLARYFSGKPFLVEYPFDITRVPDGIACIPFVSCVLPIIWMTNSTLILSELDEAFFNCIPNVKRGYETMFPECVFAGEVCAANIVVCDRPATGGCIAFFSGGMDATQTLVSHFYEKPDLLSVWGSDVEFENRAGWETLHKGIAKTCEKYNLKDIVIRSTFRTFDREDTLGCDFGEQLQDSWWHGLKHSLGLLGHAAPYIYLNGISTVYIASSNCPEDGPVRCASNPLTDNHVRFAHARVIHDGFEFSRQDKAHNIVEFVQSTGNNVSLHVCWETRSGANCCHCEKCYRTMANLLAEGADPIDYGFPDTPNTIGDMERYISITCRGMQNLPDYWPHIQKRILKNRKALRTKPYWEQIRWIARTDFHRLHKTALPLSLRIRRKLATYRFYQVLSQIKGRIKSNE